MTELGDALRKKYQNPRDALKALGLDEALITNSTQETAMSNEALARRMVTVSALHSYLKPRLALDAKVEMAKIFDGVTGKNFKDKKPAIVEQIKAQTKDKLAKDANLNDVEKVLDMLEKHEVEEGTDESVSEAQHNAMGAAAGGVSNLDIPKKVGEEFMRADKGKTFDAGNVENLKGFLKEKGMGEDDIAKACDMLAGPAATDETPEEKKKREDAEKEKAAADAKKAADAKTAKDNEMKDMVTKPAMDAAIKAATEATAKSVRSTERGIRTALDEVRPYVGELSPTLAFDSGADVIRHALGMLGVEDAKTMNADALKHVLAVQPKPGARKVDRDQPLGMDEKTTKDFNSRFADAARIGVA